MARFSITGEIHRLLKEKIGEGDIVIDATLGNGHDALFLAESIGDTGHLYGFDIQPEAIKATQTRLASQRLEHRATLLLQSHEKMALSIPDHCQGKVRCIMFNLGYLPGGNKMLTTRIDSTLAALDEGIGLLAPGGLISILAYRGHPGGARECEAVQQWTESLASPLFKATVHNFLPGHKSPPLWIMIEND